MKSSITLVVFVLFTLIASASPVNSHTADLPEPVIQSDPSDPQPFIFGVHLRGNRLIVEGANFDRRAIIRINDKRQKTLAEPDSQTTMLVVKKGGRKIKFDDFQQTIEVQNGTGFRSAQAHFFRTDSFSARMIVFGRTSPNIFVRLKAGELLLIDSRTLPSADTFDPAFLQPVPDSPFDTQQLRLYRAIQSGDTSCTIIQNRFPDLEVPQLVLHMAIHVE